MVRQGEIQFSTEGHGHVENLTGRVERFIKDSGITTGMVHLFNIGSTAAIGTIEFEPGLCADLSELLNRLIPPSTEYGHERAWHDGNAHSHLQATTLGPSLTVPIARSRLALGTWQQIFHLECDIKKRDRSVVMTALGD